MRKNYCALSITSIFVIFFNIKNALAYWRQFWYFRASWHLCINKLTNLIQKISTGAMTLSTTTLNITTLGRTHFNAVLNEFILIVVMQSAIIVTCYYAVCQHAECHYFKCHCAIGGYAELHYYKCHCGIGGAIMQSVVMLSVVALLNLLEVQGQYYKTF